MSKELRALEEVNEMINSLEEYNKLMRFRKPPKTATDIMLRKLDIVKQALIKAQENEKVLDIIKEKNIDVFRFKKLDFNTFNQLQRSCKLPELTQEEFELLKRWIEKWN